MGRGNGATKRGIQARREAPTPALAPDRNTGRPTTAGAAPSDEQCAAGEAALDAARRERLAQFVAQEPRFAPQAERLLADLSLPVSERYEYQLDPLLDRAEFREGVSRMRRMRACSCHENASRLWRADHENRLMTGYVLTGDAGGWGQHSWCERDGRIIETTVRRVRYWGMEMRGEEAARFAFDNGAGWSPRDFDSPASYPPIPGLLREDRPTR